MHHTAAMMTYSATTAWAVTCVSGILTGVILGLQTSISVAAFVTLMLTISAAIVLCARLLRPRSPQDRIAELVEPLR